MTNTAILAVSALLVLAYLLDVVGRQFKVPSVVLLIGTGMVGRFVLDGLGIHLRFVEDYVPLIGTVGLILIVLEGSLDLEVRRDRVGLILRSSASALLGFWVCLFALIWLFARLLELTPATAAILAIPFAIISSAVAIPSALGLPQDAREFVTYESALSDILGILVFYAWIAAQGSMETFLGDLFGGTVLSLLAAVVAALGVFYLINRLEGHVRFLPVLAVVALLYAAGKATHLSPLIMVLVCGLLLNNPHLLEWNSTLRDMHSLDYDQTLKEFKGVVAELTFATKSFFFLMLGYWTDLEYMKDWRAWAIALAAIAVIYLSRVVILGALRLPLWKNLTWLAPRGLITVLLFLIAFEESSYAGFLMGSVMLVVLTTSAATALAHWGLPAGPAGTGTAANELGDRPAKAMAEPVRRDHH